MTQVPAATHTGTAEEGAPLPAETPLQEYRRLADEIDRETAAHAASPQAEASPQLRAAVLRMREILATPPQGYALPPAAAGLVAHAESHGWQALVRWTSPDFDGEPFVRVIVGRKAVDADYTGGMRGPVWRYSLSWHSRGCKPGRVRLFGSGVAETPNSPQPRDAPSVKKIREIISDHPAPSAANQDS